MRVLQGNGQWRDEGPARPLVKHAIGGAVPLCGAIAPRLDGTTGLSYGQGGPWREFQIKTDPARPPRVRGYRQSQKRTPDAVERRRAYQREYQRHRRFALALSGARSSSPAPLPTQEIA